ncbi:hypothetical protein QJS04_geneDACA008133 [Acorus gramineus]|uniref:Uncharacterized protein n=1 Tax=Acorus gramineus TaxID=55184 RepID=A0AAV9AWD1_ACOGR|nr:hypothetical protein QJS04_geneDACA008133 [Acorus gramineus]
MDYDFRNRTAPSYRPPPAPASMYPRVGGGPPVPHPGGRATAVPPPPLHHPSSSAAPSGYGIKVVIKPEYRVTPPDSPFWVTVDLVLIFKETRKKWAP